MNGGASSNYTPPPTPQYSTTYVLLVRLGYAYNIYPHFLVAKPKTYVLRQLDLKPTPDYFQLTAFSLDSSEKFLTLWVAVVLY